MTSRQGRLMVFTILLTRRWGIAIHSSCNNWAKSARVLYSVIRQYTECLSWSQRCSIGLRAGEFTGHTIHSIAAAACGTTCGHRISATYQMEFKFPFICISSVLLVMVMPPQTITVLASPSWMCPSPSQTSCSVRSSTRKLFYGNFMIYTVLKLSWI